MKNRKKGFTLVELLVVIAVLAILAGVSVVAYLGFTMKAKKSKDLSLITQMNTGLQADEAVNGQADTMYDALMVLKDQGLDVEKLVPAYDGYSFAWDSSSNRMLLLDEDRNVVSPEDYTVENTEDLFVIVFSEDEISNWDNYSIYAGYNFASDDNTVEISSGFDAGFNQNLNISYVNTGDASTVSIRTNGGNLTIDAANDTIKHYGDVDSVIIKSVASESYHEFGSANDIQINKGHIVAESNSSINTIMADGDDISIDVTNSSDTTVFAPEGSTAQVTGAETRTLTNNEKQAFTIGSEMFAGGLGTAEFPFLLANQEDFANMSYDKVEAKYGDYISSIVASEGQVSYKFTKDISILISDNSKYVEHLTVREATLDYSAHVDLNGKHLGFDAENSVYIGDNNIAGFISIQDPEKNSEAETDEPTKQNVLTIDGNGTVDCEYGDSGVSAFGASDTAKLVINDGTYYGAPQVAQAINSASIEINGGYYDLSATCKETVPDLSKQIIAGHSGELLAGEVTVEIKGGSFVKYNPTDFTVTNKDVTSHFNFVPEGYTATPTIVDQEEVWTVTKA